MKKLSIFAAALLAGSALFAGPAEDAAAAKTALANVDTDGVYLHYMALSEFFVQLQKSVLTFTGELSADNADAARIHEAAALIFKTLKLEELKAQAVSFKNAGNGVWHYRSFIYTGADRPTGALFAISGTENVELPAMKALPPETILAMESRIALAPVYALIAQNLSDSTDPEIKMLPAKMAKEFKAATKCELVDVLNSIDGNAFLLVAGPVSTPEMLVVIPDKTGVLAKLFKDNGMQFDAQSGIAPLPLPPLMPHLKPVVIAKNGTLTIASSLNILNKVAKAKADGGLLKSAVFAKFTAGAPTAGNSAAVLRIDRNLIGAVMALAPEETREPLAQLARRDIDVYAINGFTPNGNFTWAATDISGADMVSAYFNFAFGMIAPALNQARDKAKTIQCLNNAKQIATALMIYSADNKDLLPPSLAALATGNYLNEDVMVCPLGSQYIYLGNGVKISEVKKPAIVPVLIDVHEKNATVAFIDGHVEMINGEFSDPSEVIGLLVSRGLDTAAAQKLINALPDQDRTPAPAAQK